MNVTIKAGEKVSSIGDLGDQSLAGLQIGDGPSVALNFLASNDGQTFGTLRNDGTAPVQALLYSNSVIWLESEKFPARFLRLVLDEPQREALVIQLILKGGK